MNLLSENDFELIQQLQSCGSFDALAKHLCESLPGVIGLGKVLVLDCYSTGEVESLYGTEYLPQELQGKLKDLRMCPTLMASQTGELKEWVECADRFYENRQGQVFGGVFVSGKYRKACLLVLIEKGKLDLRQVRLIRMIVSFAMVVLRGIGALAYESAIRRQVIRFRADCPATYFNLSMSGELAPMNHPAVAFAEKHWQPDEPVLLLDDEARSTIEESIKTAWFSPVESSWVETQIDIGGGMQQVYLIPRGPGDIVLMIQTKPANQSLAGVEDMLTKRQAEIMNWIAEGKTSGEVATILSISPRTVEKHLEAIFERLGVENRITATRRFLELKGLL